MLDFLLGPDLWANILGGVVAAGLIAGWVKLRESRRHKIIKELIEIMGRAVEHRNNGEKVPLIDANEWIRQAEAIEAEAVGKANELSTTAGSLLQWLDRVEPYPRGDEVKRYISILGVVIARIRGIMERYS